MLDYVRELPSLSYLATTQAQALRGITKLTASVIEDMQKTGEKIPCPTSTKQYSGKFMVRVPPAVHRLLAINALEAHVSLNRYVSTILATGSTNV